MADKRADQRRPFAPSHVVGAPSVEPGPVSGTRHPSGRLTVLATIPAQGAVLLGPRVIALGPDFRVVSAVDVTTGDEIWRVPLPGHPSGQHILQRLGPRPLLRRGDDLIVLDPATGRIVAQHRGPMSDRRFVHRVRDVCMLNGSCTAQLIDCDDARPLGALLESVRIFRHEVGEDGHSVGHGSESCAGFDVQLVGRAGDLLVFTGRGLRRRAPRPGAPHRPKSLGANVLAAIHAETGSPAWEHHGRGCGFCGGGTVGISADGALGWLVRDDTLDVFRTRDGRNVWTRQFDDRVVGAVWFDGAVDGLFVTTEREVAAVAPNGRPRFVRALDGPDTLPLLKTALLPELAQIHFVREQEQVAWLDPSTGAVLETVPFTNRVLVADSSGHPVIVAHEEMRDAAGHVIEGTRHAVLDVDRTRRADTGAGPPNHAVVRERKNGTALMRIEDDAWSIGEWSAPGNATAPRFAALYVHRADEPGEVRIVRFDAD